MEKALLDTPEDEIDPQRLPIKDLILLAEHRERIAVSSLYIFNAIFLMGGHDYFFLHFIVRVFCSCKFNDIYLLLVSNSFEQIKDAAKLKTPQSYQRCLNSLVEFPFLLAPYF